MSAYCDAMALYETPQEFDADLYFHLIHGNVLSTPGAFLMARPVNRDWSEEQINDLSRVAPSGDTWFIWCFSGRIQEIVTFLTPKKYVAYARRGVLRWHSYERLHIAFTKGG